MKPIKISKSEIEENKVKIIETKYTQIGITKLSGQYIAFEDICTHDGEPISTGKLEGTCIECPRHQAKFDLTTGKALKMPATEDLKVFKIQESETELEIEMEE